MNKKGRYSQFTLRPYQLLCILCSIGEDDSGPRNERLKKIFEAIRKNPDIPITLKCNAGDVYVYQDPGLKEDNPESPEFNRKRDLDILQKLDMAPGETLPARTLLYRLFKMIPTVSGICGYNTTTSSAWKGCPKAKSENYEKGVQGGIDVLIPPRKEEEMEKEKKKSLEAMYNAKEITIRPHILLCAICQFGGGTRPPFKPDNLPEMLQYILKKPDIKIKLARGADWMMCAPCPKRVPELNACVNVAGSGGLSNEKRDLDMLQKLGLTYGAAMKAKELYKLIFEKIPTTMEICKRESYIPNYSVWCDGCGEKNRIKGNENYEKGREVLMREFK